MLKRNAIAVITVLFVLGLPAIEAGEKIDPAAGTSVVIDSRPDHAEIRLNGKFIGTTPLSYPLPAGVHKIELARPQFESWYRELTVAETPTRVVALLQRGSEADCGEQ